MDKNSIIGYILIFVIFGGWLLYSSNKQELQQKEMAEAQEMEQHRLDSIAEVERIDSLAEVAAAAKLKEALIKEGADTNEVAEALEALHEVEEVVEEKPEQLFTIGNKELKLQFTSKGGIVNRAELLNYKRSDSTDLLLIEPGTNKFSYSIPLKSDEVETSDLDFEVKSQSESQIVLVHNFEGGGSIEQEYTLGEKFLVDYKLRLIDLQDKIHKRSQVLDVNWDMDIPLQEKAMKSERDVSTVYYKYKSEKGIDYLSPRGDEEEDKLLAGVHWVSYKQQFFMSTLIFPEGLDESGAQISVVKDENSEYVGKMSTNLSVPIGFTPFDEHDMQLYFGPNHYQTLKKLDIGLERTIELGPKIFSWVNKLIVIPIFNWLSKFISSYGIIILLLTLFIKLVLIVPMYKSYLSTAKMRILKPELEAIKEKTGGDMTKMQQEQMKLYKKVGVSPFGGCLPQLVQLPILIALFRFFPSSIELRQKSFLWADDLSTYDAVISWGTDIWLIGDHLSLFTLLMAASSLLYTIYNQQSSAGMNNQMKYIMYLMPVMLFFWFNSYAAGLSYYYFLANMITFGQNFVFSKWIVDEEKIRKQMEANKKKKVTVKPSRFQKKLEEMAKKRGVDPKQLRR